MHSTEFRLVSDVHEIGRFQDWPAFKVISCRAAWHYTANTMPTL